MFWKKKIISNVFKYMLLNVTSKKPVTSNVSPYNDPRYIPSIGFIGVVGELLTVRVFRFFNKWLKNQRVADTNCNHLIREISCILRTNS